MKSKASKFKVRWLIIAVVLAAYGIWAPVVLADVLVSKSRSQESQLVSESSEPAAPAKRTVRLKFRPRDPAPVSQAPEAGSYLAVNEAEDSYQDYAPAEDPLEFSDEDPHQLAYSKSRHPLATTVENVSPVKQTVSGPRTNYYGNARPASVVYPGRQSGGTGRVVQVTSGSTGQTQDY